MFIQMATVGCEGLNRFSFNHLKVAILFWMYDEI